MWGFELALDLVYRQVRGDYLYALISWGLYKGVE
jgi:hypothetical protein